MMVPIPARSIPWPRILAEGFAIVVSILLAFGIQAWWELRSDRRAELVLLEGLRADFVANNDRIAEQLTFHGRLVGSAERLLADIRSRPVGTQVAVPDSALAAVLASPTYDPLTSTLDAALASGDIELIENTRVRETLADWRRVAADMRANELAVRDVVHNSVVPLLSEQARLAVNFENVVDWSLGDAKARAALSSVQSIRVTSQLEGAVGLQLYNSRFVARDLEQLAALQADLVAAIEASLRDSTRM